jgi:hypothetical protein
MLVDVMVENMVNTLAMLDGNYDDDRFGEGDDAFLASTVFDRVVLEACLNQDLYHMAAEELQLTFRALQQACQAIMQGHDEVLQYVLQKQRAGKGITEVVFDASFEAFCVFHTGYCQPWDLWTPERFARLCAPFWTKDMCVDRYRRPYYWKVARPGSEAQIPEWWDDLDERRASLRGSHPLLQGPINDEIASAAVRAEAQRIAEKSDVHLPVMAPFLYLCQARTVTRLPESFAALTSASSDFMVLTWGEAAPGAIFYPGCILGAGRQVLFAAARQQERLQGWRYSYWIMLDDDVPFMRGGPREFEQFLRYWEPAVGVPANYWHHARWRKYHDAGGAFATYHPDHQLIAYHHEAIEELWPFDLSWDSRCWWTSQWHQSALTGVKFRGHLLVSKEVVIANPRHDTYPNDDMAASYHNATEHLRSQLPASVKHCARHVAETEIGMPWGAALRKGARSYADWDVRKLGPDCEYRDRMPGVTGEPPMRYPPVRPGRIRGFPE